MQLELKCKHLLTQIEAKIKVLKIVKICFTIWKEKTVACFILRRQSFGEQELN